MTLRLYVEDPYLRECTATVTEIKENTVFLDRTVFYPEGGGQLGDTGWIENLRVVDAQKSGGRLFTHPDFPSIKVGSQVAHILEKAPEQLEVGQEVRLHIDWQRRYTLMRMHSAAHIVYHFMFEVFGKMPVKGCRIAEDSSRFDFFTEQRFDRDRLDQVERLANDFIDKDVEIRMLNPVNEPEARIWECEGIQIPCGGTHVKRTGEIGHVTLKRRGKSPTVERVYISLAGGANV
ncbi:alanyl-tRNA editing protein [Staphylospora marina]|uniref:alanyl-tRNA editing protein n=1 Tax=Staphylospora marina TaxID=2490858 RepID=UPI000F5C1605|nr:alanyl-tRNA editing protein [Staphylospora marina]